MNSLMKLAFSLICLALLAAAHACSEGRDGGLMFDPDRGHSKAWRTEHGAASLSTENSCEPCHGSDLRGGISDVGCFESSFDGQACHAGGPGVGHGTGWRSAHATSPPEGAAECAACHRSQAGTPGCFNNTLCHGEAGSPHGSGWRSSHRSTSPGRAAECAACHRSRSGTAGCFNNTLCHGEAGSPHGSNWRSSHRSTSPSRAAECAACHRSRSGTAGCFNNTLCHGDDDDEEEEDD